MTTAANAQQPSEGQQAPAGDPPAPPIVAPPQPPPPAPPPAQVFVNDPAAIERARAEGRAEGENAARIAAQAAAAAAAKPQEVQLIELSTQVQALTANMETERRARRAAELRAHMQGRLLEVQRAGEHLVLSMVGGDSEDAIDASIAAAKAEYARIEADVLARFAAQQAAPPPAAPPTVSATAPVAVQLTPSAFPSAIAGPPVVEAPSAIAGLDVAYLTSAEAVRNGDYAKHRAQLLAGLRGGQHGQVPIASSPRVAPSAPAAPPRTAAPVIAMRPATPTPAAAPQPGAVVAAPGDAQQPFDAAAARAYAVEVAKRHLANPATATSDPRTGARNAAMAAIGYGARPNLDTGMLDAGVHPMEARNS